MALKTGEMTGLERVVSALQHKEGDRVPAGPLVCASARRVLGVNYQDWAQDSELAVESMVQAQKLIVAAQPAAARLLVLLSDGRPYDMGYGDMRYAMEDTKMALAEARHAGVSPFCITVDPKGPDYLEDLFGLNGYTVIQNVGHLPTKLPRIYRNLTV